MNVLWFLCPAESITDDATIILSGGKCGVKKDLATAPVAELNVSIYMAFLSELDPLRLQYLGELYLNRTFLSPLSVQPRGLSSATYGGAIHALMEATVLLSLDDQAAAANAYSTIANGNSLTQY